MITTRRQFLVAGASVTGSFVLGVPITGFGNESPNDTRMLGYFIEITPDGRVIIGNNQPGLGRF